MKAFKQKGPNDEEEGQEKDSTSVVHMIRSRKTEQCSKKKAYTQSQRAVSTHTQREIFADIVVVVLLLSSWERVFLHFSISV